MKRAIIVKGQSGSGKSTVLLAIYDWIVINYSPIITNAWHAGYKGCYMQIGKLKIGFNSAGDEGPNVEEFLNNCIADNCDLIIGACRDKGSTKVAVVSILTYPDFVVDLVRTYHVKAHEITFYNNQWIDEVKARLMGLPKP